MEPIISTLILYFAYVIIEEIHISGLQSLTSDVWFYTRDGDKDLAGGRGGYNNSENLMGRRKFWMEAA